MSSSFTPKTAKDIVQEMVNYGLISPGDQGSRDIVEIWILDYLKYQLEDITAERNQDLERRDR